MFENGIRDSQERNNTIRLICGVEGLASLSFQKGRAEHAALPYAWTDVMREKIRHQRPPIEQASMERDLAVVHSKLPDSAFAHLVAEGKTMSIENAVAIALEE